ncbi:sensor histidine kinase [Streptomyces sp. NPDC093221]|uniref:sensor histidine kinase n=1 Tax=Streptomyces sp. NPDC093221 TaxID=3366032 RepID=UPI003820E445
MDLGRELSMDFTHSPLKRLSRVRPGTWMALIWFAVTAYTVFEQTQTRGLSVLDLSLGNQLDEALAAVLVLAAARRERRPLPALCLLLTGTVCSVLAMAVGDIPLLQFLAVDVAVCYLAATQPLRTSATAGVLALATLVGYSGGRALLGYETDATTTLTAALTTAIVWLVGNAVWQRHAHAEALRAEATERAITSERLRIARELHDMVAHTIGIVALQAGAARQVFDTQPDRARAALGEIETAGRETLTGLRRMLGALREADGNGADGNGADGNGADANGAQGNGSAGTGATGRGAHAGGAHAGGDGTREAVRPAPAPGIADVPRLAETTTAAGVRVDVTWSGVRRQLPPEIELSAYRIVQEAVTNVVRHAGARSCAVTIDFRAAELAVEVSNPGADPEPHPARTTTHGVRAPARGGYGIVGMRERVGLLHGDFSAQPRPDGGFRVMARLPVPPQEAQPAPDAGTFTCMPVAEPVR